MSISAFVTVKFRLDNICNQDDFGPGEPFETFDALVRNLIEEEGGVLGLVEDQGEILTVMEAR